MGKRRTVRVLVSALVISSLSAGSPGVQHAFAAALVTERVSLTATGGQASGNSEAPSISADGRFVAFDSEAADIVPGDTNHRSDVFVRDRASGTTVAVSVRPDGKLSAGGGYQQKISDDGRFVAFYSFGTDLVPGVTQPGEIYVRDLRAGTTVVGSVNSVGMPANANVGSVALSADGKHLAFSTSATNMSPLGACASCLYVHDLVGGSTELASVSSTGQPGSGGTEGISADGRFVTFSSNLGLIYGTGRNTVYEIWLHDMLTHQTELISVAQDGGLADGWSLSASSVSADGRYVVFESDATNLVVGDTNHVSDIFMRDRVTGTTTRLTMGVGGAQPNIGSVLDPVITPDGRLVAFTSEASNLVPGDTNRAADAFVWDRATGSLTRVSITSSGGQSSGGRFGPMARQPSIASRGGGVARGSVADNL